MKTTPLCLRLLPGVILLSSGLIHAADIQYASGLTSPTDITTAANWIGGIAPGSGDSAAWVTDVAPLTAGNQESTAGTLNVSSPVSWLGLKFQDAAGAGTMSGSVITLGSGGIQMGFENLTINNVIAGTSGLNITRFVNGGTLNLAGANTYTGNTTLNGGTTQASNAAAFSTSAVTVAANSTLTVSTAIANNIGVNSGVTLTLNGGFVNVNGIISGAGNIAANNTIQLRGANTYTGNSSVSAGFLCIDKESSLGAVPAAFNAASLTLSGGGNLSNYIAPAAITLSANRGITLATGSTGGFDVVGQSLTINGIITGGGNLRKQGNSNLILNGVNTYTGGTTLATGTLTVGNASALGSGAVTVTGNSTLRVVVGTGFTNNITVNSGFTLTTGGGFNNISGIISGAGNVAANDSIHLRGINTYTGNTSVSAGFLTIDKDASLGAIPAAFNAASLSLSGGGYLSNYIASAPVVLNANRGVTLAAGTTGGFDIVGQPLTINGAISGTGNLRKQGNNNLILNGTNTYTGTTTVAVGTLSVNGSLASSGVTVQTGAALDAAGTITGPVTVNTGGTLRGSNGIFNGLVTVAGTHSPGSSPGLQTFTAGLTYASTAVINIELNGNTLATRGTDYDGINLTGGALTYDPATSLNLIATGIDYTNPLWAADRSFTLIALSGSATAPAGVMALTTANAGTFAPQGTWSLANTGGNTVLNWTAVPEPTASLLTALAALLPLTRRRRTA